MPLCLVNDSNLKNHNYVSLYIYIYTCSLLEILGYKQGNNLKQVLLRSMFSMTLSSIVMLWEKKVVNFEALLISTFK